MKVLILGYFDNNIGDDLMILTITKRFPKVEFYTYSTNNIINETFKRVDNFHIINSNLTNSELVKYDACLKIGGSLFIVEYKSHVIQRIREVLLSRKLHKRKIPSAVVGSNLGPFKQRFAKYLVKKELSYKNMVTVRDKASFNELEGYGIKSKIALFDDIVYSYSIQKVSHDEKTLGISVYNSHKIENKIGYLKNLSLLCQMYLKQGYTVKLFSFDSESENDLVNCLHIKNYVSKEYQNEVFIVPYLGNQNEFLKELSSCSLFLATRFHSAILSDLYNIPYYPICYSNKLINFLKDNEYKGTIININDFSIMDRPDIENYFFNEKNLFSNKNNNNSIGHIEYIHEFLEGCI